MRHRVDHRKLGRTAAHRKAMLRNMVTSLFAAERITTTDAKAKEARRLAERLITRAKKGHAAQEAGDTGAALAHWRQAGRYIRRTDVLKKLFEEIAPHYADRNGGYTRIVKLDKRLGDNARTVLLELVDTAVTRRPLVKSTGEGHDTEVEPTNEEETKAKGKGKSKAKGKSKTKGKGKSKSKTKTKSKSKSKSKTKAKGKSKSKSKSKAKGKTKAKSKKA